MSPKPFKKIVENKDKNISNEDIIKPFKVDSKESIERDNIDFLEDKIEDNSKSIAKNLNLFTTFNGIVVALLIFILIAIVADTVETLSNIITSGTVASYIYLIGLVFLLSVLVLNIVINLSQLKFIKKSNNMQDKFSIEKKEPSEKIIPLTNSLLNHYAKSEDKEIIKTIEGIRERLNKSEVYKDIYQDIDSKLLAIMDKKAENKIRTASIQAGLSTAISPFPLLDMILILWRSVSLTKEIAIIYGFRPRGLTTIVLLRKSILNIAFAGVTQLAVEATNDIAGATLLSKISTSAGQGIANGILLARLGYGVIDACRPLKITTKKESFIKSIISSIFKSKEEVK